MRIAKLILSTLFTICILGLVAGGVLYVHLKILLTIGRKPKNRRITTTDANLYR